MRNTINDDHLDILRKEMENIFHHKISTSTNCDQLSKEIRNKTSQYLSSQTLRRIFGLVKSTTSPSLFTLDALSQYCGYQDWNQFCAEKERVSTPSGQTESLTKWILDFYKVPLPKLWPSPDYFMACKNIAERIVLDDSLSKTLPSQLATLPLGQILFFECFPYIDGLGNGYQKHLKVYLRSKSNNYESQIFANCLLFMGAYLTENERQIKHYYSIVNSLKCPSPKQIHEIPLGRYMGVQILYNTHIGNYREARSWLEKSLTTCLPDDHIGPGFVNYRFVLSEYLLLTGHYAECVRLLRYMEDPYWNKFFITYTVDFEYLDVAKLIRAIANIRLGNIVIGKNSLKQINQSSFIFTVSKLYSLFFLHQQLSLCSTDAVKKRTKLVNQINTLVNETRFTYFSVAS